MQLTFAAGCHRHDAGAATVVLGKSPYLTCCLYPVQFGHFHIHQNQIEPFGLSSRDRLAPIADASHPVRTHLQQPLGHFLVDGAIVRQQDFL